MRLWFVALLITIAAPADAGPPGKYTNYGAGTQSCGGWLAARRKGTFYSETNWVLGWVSAAGYYGVSSGGLKDTDSEAIAAWIDNYCRANPLSAIHEAASNLVIELADRAKY